MTRISISINSTDEAGRSKSYNVSLKGDFSKVRTEIDKIYEKFKTEEVKDAVTA